MKGRHRAGRRATPGFPSRRPRRRSGRQRRRHAGGTTQPTAGSQCAGRPRLDAGWRRRRARWSAPATPPRSVATDGAAGHDDDQRVRPHERRGGAHQRRRPRARTDSRLQRRRLRSDAATCRPSSCATRTTAASRASWPTARRSARVHIQNRSYPAGKTSYNAIAEIPGTDKADEVVMLGGHLDSWHSATGATDNAIGCAVMMEAARILQAIGVKPRRTIRVALWGGEEQGLLGSKAYVEQHFGTAENPEAGVRQVQRLFQRGRRHRAGFAAARSSDRPEAAADPRTVLQAVRGSRRVRRDQRRPAGRPAAPTARRSTPPACRASAWARTRSSTDSHTWHTNLDTIERIVEEDVKKSAVAIASAVYHVAMREQMLPRFAPDKMPAPPAPAGRGGGAPAASQR